MIKFIKKYAKVLWNSYMEMCEKMYRYYKVVRKAHSFRGGMDSTFIL